MIYIRNVQGSKVIYSPIFSSKLDDKYEKFEISREREVSTSFMNSDFYFIMPSIYPSLFIKNLIPHVDEEIDDAIFHRVNRLLVPKGIPIYSLDDDRPLEHLEELVANDSQLLSEFYNLKKRIGPVKIINQMKIEVQVQDQQFYRNYSAKHLKPQK